jgi:hypothetical protein
MSSTVIINGVSYSGSSVVISGSKVVIDGKEQDQTVSGVVEVRITEGRLNNLTTDGSVQCADVEGSVNAGGSIKCAHIGRSATAGGSIKCGVIHGSATAGGSIRTR